MSFCEEWNSHPISGEGHDQSPQDMHLLGQLEHGVYLENGVSLNPDVVSHYYGLQHPANQPTSGDSSDDDGWEDIMDHSDMTADHSDLPSMIADDQASEFAHDGAAVPVEVDPFPPPTGKRSSGRLCSMCMKLAMFPMDMACGRRNGVRKATLS
ncbi:hypothetical protein BKA82DRAFT_4365520 [Pisolithus tinctorius]|nr:hypothetical protein BKA82DRAFT_4365520 [Pisolithus tinctorius]